MNLGYGVGQGEVSVPIAIAPATEGVLAESGDLEPVSLETTTESSDTGHQADMTREEMAARCGNPRLKRNLLFRS